MSTKISHQKLQLRWEKLDFYLDSTAVFPELYSGSDIAFWLDSPAQTSGRFSFMGDVSGPNSAWCEYFLANKALHWYEAPEHTSLQLLPASFLDFLRETLKARKFDAANFPLEFNGGFVGYLGYELKAECGYPVTPVNKRPFKSTEPDACFIFADRFVGFDHQKQIIYLAECYSPDSDNANSEWIAATEARLEKLKLGLDEGQWRTMANAGPHAGKNNGEKTAEKTAEKAREKTPENISVKKRVPDTNYLLKIAEIKQLIQAGETYEACLTNQLEVATQAAPLALYQVMRSLNPAPFASFLRFPGFSVVGASPEKFLHIDKFGHVETKPIKGTCPRAPNRVDDARLRDALAQSEKNRAENLMIVDLLRNDLGKVSEIGSVKVSKLFAVESFATVHQLVSTIESRLAKGKDAVDCVAACFPGGSMTGAPKRRTLEILQQLEPGPRGIYSGAIGYFSLNGSAQLNIVIRSIVMAAGYAKMGVGGAIVDASSAEEELEETNIKARALLQALSYFR